MLKRKHEREPDPDALVAVGTYGAIEAELVAGKLREAGIDAVVFGTGAEGAYPHLVFADGSRVMVRRRDVEAAYEVVGD